MSKIEIIQYPSILSDKEATIARLVDTSTDLRSFPVVQHCQKSKMTGFLII